MGVIRGCWTALPLLLALPAAAAAQEAVPATQATLVTPDNIDFSADVVTYENGNDVVTAEGRVRLNRDGYYLAADKVVWNRNSGQVTADGNVVVLSPEGNRLVGDHVVLADNLRDGTVQNLLIVLDSGGRIAADSATRTGDRTVLQNGIYSGCPVVDSKGCPKTPSWSITATQIVQDARTGRISFRGGRLNLFGIGLPLLPIFAVNAAAKSGSSGALIPDISFSHSNGLELSVPYYFRFSSNRDLTLTPRLFTKNAPGVEARYRQLTSIGAFQVGGFATYGKIEHAGFNASPATRHGVRAYLEANGKAQLSPEWSITASLRGATDKTVTRRYDLTRDDRLRNFVEAERITPNSYISIAAWAFQGLRVDDRQRQLPMALPAIDARFRLEDPVLGGKIELQGNSLAIVRLEGQDTQRAFASGRWDLRKLTRGGQQLTFTAYGRGDVYHTSEAEQTSVPTYRGENGWHFRGIGALAADLQYPLIGPFLGGLQRLTPRVQLVLTPPTPNLNIPNEDARAVDLEDSNLFALNRFPGYDRWEDGSRITSAPIGRSRR